MHNEFTAIIEPAEEGGYFAYCPEIPGANGQGETAEAAKANLVEAIELILTDRREDGITPNEAIRIVDRQITLRGDLPFPVGIPNERTAATLRRSSQGKDVQHFESVDAMFNSWEK